VHPFAELGPDSAAAPHPAVRRAAMVTDDLKKLANNIFRAKNEGAPATPVPRILWETRHPPECDVRASVTRITAPRAPTQIDPVVRSQRPGRHRSIHVRPG
jgi:hypothetical protein